jgi:hypothetical protein
MIGKWNELGYECAWGDLSHIEFHLVRVLRLNICLVWRLEVPNREFQFANAICPTSGCFKYEKSFLVKKFRLKYAKGPALKGRLSFSPCISKTF